MNTPTPSQDGLLDAEDLRSAFEAQFPDADDQEIAALMAAFLEDVPAVTTTDDGAHVAQTDPAEQAAIQSWIADLKAFAGNAYPPHSERSA